MRTRRESIAAAAAFAAAAALEPGAARAAAASPATATTTDRGVLTLLAAYGDRVVFAYELALRGAPLRAGDSSRLTALRDQAAHAYAAVVHTLERVGGAPPPRPPRASTELPPEVARKADRAAYLGYIVSSENAAIGGWYTALQAFTGRALIAGSTPLMAAAGRRLVALRSLLDRPPLAGAFETGGL